MIRADNSTQLYKRRRRWWFVQIIQLSCI